MENYADLMFRGEVARLQEEDGAHGLNQANYMRRGAHEIGPEERRFIESRESFYISSVAEDGWPYVQHRGGPQGFLKVLGRDKIGCLDYMGNRQFITMGHVATDPRVSLFLMDYYQRTRLKIQGRAKLVKLEDADDAARAALPSEGTPAQRLLTIEVVSFDWNCPKYIPPLVPVAAANAATEAYTEELQAEVARLKVELAAKS